MIKIEFTNGKPALEFPEAETIREAVEQAVARKISLSKADLRRSDLRGADLSFADLCFADLSGADLSFADLSFADLSFADLSKADLSKADLRRSDLCGADLRFADLRGADLDYGSWPLWCGSLSVKIDKKIFCQLLYHVVRAGQSVEDEEVRKFLDLPEVIALANQFHRVKECGEIKKMEGAKK